MEDVNISLTGGEVGIDLGSLSEAVKIINPEISNATNASIFQLTDTYTNNLTFNNSKGEIHWARNNLTTYLNLTINKTVFLQQNLTGLMDGPAQGALNATATVKIKSLTFTRTPHLRLNLSICDNLETCNITSYNNGILTAEVSRFSNYTAWNNTAPNITNMSFYLNQTLYTNTTFLLANVTVSDANGENVTLNATWFVNGTMRKSELYNVSNGSITLVNLSLTDYDYGKWDIIDLNVTVTDGLDLNYTRNLTTQVHDIPPNLATLIPSVSLFDGNTETITLTDYFADEDNDNITFHHPANNSIVGFFMNNASKVLSIYGLDPGTRSIFINATDGNNFTASNNFTITIWAVGGGGAGGSGSGSSGGGGGGGSSSKTTKPVEKKVDPPKPVVKKVSCGLNEKAENGVCQCVQGFIPSDVGCVCPSGMKQKGQFCVTAGQKEPISSLYSLYGEQKVPPTFMKKFYNPFDFVGCMEAHPVAVQDISQDVYLKAIEFPSTGKEFSYDYDVEGDILKLYVFINKKQGKMCSEFNVFTKDTTSGDVKSANPIPELFQFDNLDGGHYFFTQQVKIKGKCASLVDSFASGLAWIEMKEMQCI